MEVHSSQNLLFLFLLVSVQVSGQNGSENITSTVSTTEKAMSTTNEVTNSTTLSYTTNQTTPSYTTNQTTPINTTNQTTPSYTTNQTTPTTTSQTTLYTTPSSKSTTSQTTPPTPALSPAFPKNVGNWISKCILMKGALQLIFSTSAKPGTADLQTINVPPEAGTSASCSSTTTQSLQLQWFTPEDKWRYSLLFTFMENTTDDTYAITEIGFSYTLETSLSEKNNQIDYNGAVLTSGDYYTTHINHSYFCVSKQMIDGDLKIRTADFQFEAFRVEEGSSFSDPEICHTDLSHVGAIVGIVLGSLLLALISVGIGVFLGLRYGFGLCFPCCKRSARYQRLDTL